jgi:hypothetical protein
VQCGVVRVIQYDWGNAGTRNHVCKDQRARYKACTLEHVLSPGTFQMVVTFNAKLNTLTSTKTL